ncbi:MAG: hypothetical protein N2044_12860 [Cyclobacteriaceae bacterium]|nr:hypothetical protein [Cyclobacteriaceae bacterium]
MEINRLILLFIATAFASNVAILSVSAQSSSNQTNDVIIRSDGVIIQGKVIEINLQAVKYLRTDIPDGPVVEIPRNKVYAISYRNQITEYLQSVDSTVFSSRDSRKDKKGSVPWSDRWYAGLDSGRLQVGLGFIRSYSLIRNVESLTNQKSSPAFYLSYTFPVRRNISVGLLSGYASFNYSENQINEYDQVRITRNIRENLFTVAAVGVYRLGQRFIDPYMMAGLAFYSSRANSNGIVEFLETSQFLTIENSASGSSFGFVIRGGVSLTVNNIGIYADFGNGLTLLQCGALFKLDFKK